MFINLTPNSGFKRQGFYYSKADLKNNTFELEDIFDSQSLQHLQNSSLFVVTEVWTLMFGRCYMIEQLAIEIELKFGFTAPWDITIYVHTQVQ